MLLKWGGTRVEKETERGKRSIWPCKEGLVVLGEEGTVYKVHINICVFKLLLFLKYLSKWLASTNELLHWGVVSGNPLCLVTYRWSLGTHIYKHFPKMSNNTIQLLLYDGIFGFSNILNWTYTSSFGGFFLIRKFF